jgi:hypothetical protein
MVLDSSSLVVGCSDGENLAGLNISFVCLIPEQRSTSLASGVDCTSLNPVLSSQLD